MLPITEQEFSYLEFQVGDSVRWTAKGRSVMRGDVEIARFVKEGRLFYAM